jgi:hypothetical protein
MMQFADSEQNVRKEQAMRGAAHSFRVWAWLPVAALAALLSLVLLTMLPGDFGMVEFVTMVAAAFLAGLAAVRVRAWGQHD